MRLLGGVLAAVAVLAMTAEAQSQPQSPLEVAEASYPPCALQCLAKLVPQSVCSLTDINCLCTNEPLNNNVTICVSQQCTIMEGLRESALPCPFYTDGDALTSSPETQNVSSTLCGAPIRNQSLTTTLAGTIPGAAALLVFLLRMCSALPAKGRKFGWDDWTIAAATALAVPPTVFAPICKSMWCLRRTCALRSADRCSQWPTTASARTCGR